jgi:Flp pilus assembly protein TadB
MRLRQEIEQKKKENKKKEKKKSDRKTKRQHVQGKEHIQTEQKSAREKNRQLRQRGDEKPTKRLRVVKACARVRMYSAHTLQMTDTRGVEGEHKRREEKK